MTQRIVHLLGTSQVGGVETFVLSLAREIDPAYALSVVITDGDGPVSEQLRALGVDVVLLGRSPRTAGDWWVYTQAMRARRGAILHANLGGRALRIAARVAGCATHVVHLHGPTDEDAAVFRSDPQALSGRVRRWASGARRVLTCSRAFADQLRAALPDVRARLEVVHYGVDGKAYEGPEVDADAQKLRAQLRIDAYAPVMAFVGRLAPQKGIEHLVNIAHRVLAERSSAHVLVAGDGPLRQHLRAVETGPYARRFHALGWRRDVAAVLASADVLVVPSLWEAFGIVCIEAAAAGRAVAAFAVDGIPEAVVDGETGLLAPPGDGKALTERVLRLLDDQDLRTRLGRGGKTRVDEHFQARFTARHLEQIYMTLAGASRVTT